MALKLSSGPVKMYSAAGIEGLHFRCTVQSRLDLKDSDAQRRWKGDEDLYGRLVREAWLLQAWIPSITEWGLQMQRGDPRELGEGT